MRAVRALEHTNDAALDTSVALHPLDADDHAVAMHGFIEVGAWNVDVAAALDVTLGNDEAIAGGMRLQTSDVEVHLLGQTVTLPANLNQVAVGDQTPSDGGGSAARSSRGIFRICRSSRVPAG